MSEPTPLQTRILQVVDKLDEGEVVSFADIATRAGNPRAARAVGKTLSEGGDVYPWWRVDYSDGHLPPCNPGLQADRLANEKVEMQGFRVICSPKGRFAKS